MCPSDVTYTVYFRKYDGGGNTGRPLVLLDEIVVGEVTVPGEKVTRINEPERSIKSWLRQNGKKVPRGYAINYDS